MLAKKFKFTNNFKTTHFTKFTLNRLYSIYCLTGSTQRRKAPKANKGSFNTASILAAIQVIM